jgi:hypothetical protein
MGWAGVRQETVKVVNVRKELICTVPTNNTYGEVEQAVRNKLGLASDTGLFILNLEVGPPDWLDDPTELVEDRSGTDELVVFIPTMDDIIMTFEHSGEEPSVFKSSMGSFDSLGELYRGMLIAMDTVRKSGKSGSCLKKDSHTTFRKVADEFAPEAPLHKLYDLFREAGKPCDYGVFYFNWNKHTEFVGMVMYNLPDDGDYSGDERKMGFKDSHPQKHTKTLRSHPCCHTLVSKGCVPEIACKISCDNSAGTVYNCFLLWLTVMPRAVPCCALSLCLPPTTCPQSPTHKGLERH